MKRFFFISLLLFIFHAIDAQATDWYVRSGAGGNGTSWTSAWSNVTNISWASISPGDTIWIAGGSYGALNVGKSGNADNEAGRIFIKRATVTAHGADIGWSNGYDSQVALSSIKWTALNVGNYVTIDGQVDSGIKINVSQGEGSGISFDRGVSYATIRYVEIAGPCGSTACTQGGDNRGIDTTAWNGSSYELVDRLTVQHTKVHGGCTLLWIMNADNSTWEYNDFYDNDATDYVPCHPNVIATNDTANLTFRYNRIHNWSTEGIMMYGGAAVNWYVYGNLWYAAKTSSYPRILEAQERTQGPVYFYNNTVIGPLYMTWNVANGGTWHSSSASKNNIYWNSNGNGLPGQSNDFCSGTCGGSNSISNGSNPFVSLSGGDYHIVSTVGANYPKDKGINLGSPYILDIDGNIRGGGGMWDIGAYEYVSGGGGATTHTVTPSAGPNGSISPGTSQTVNDGSTMQFTVTPNAGYSVSVGGTCGGSLVGTTYTTNAITADCTVSATFTLNTATRPSPPPAVWVQ